MNVCKELNGSPLLKLLKLVSHPDTQGTRWHRLILTK